MTYLIYLNEMSDQLDIFFLFRWWWLSWTFLVGWKTCQNCKVKKYFFRDLCVAADNKDTERGYRWNGGKINLERLWDANLSFNVNTEDLHNTSTEDDNGTLVTIGTTRYSQWCYFIVPSSYNLFMLFATYGQH